MIDVTKRYAAVVAICAIASAGLPFTVAHAESDQANLVQQILTVVRDVQTKVTSLIGTTYQCRHGSDDSIRRGCRRALP